MGLAAATVGAGALAAGGAIISSSNSANAAEKAGQETSDATKYAADLQNQEFEQGLALEMPSYRVGQGALGLYASALGLPGYALESGGGSPTYATTTPSATSSAGSAMVQGAGKNNMFAGTSEGGITQDQANSILSNRPDVLSAYNALPSNTKSSFGSPQAYAAYWYNKYGQSGGYQIPSSATSTAAATPSSGGSLQSQNAGALSSVLGGSNIGALVEATPGYQSQLQQGVDAISASAAAKGTLNGGGLDKALDTFGQQTFGNYYDKWLGNVGSLAGLGASTATTAANQGLSSAAQQGSLAVTGANAVGQAGVNAANAWSSGAGGAIGSLNGILNNSSLYNSSGSYYGEPAGWSAGPPSTL